MPARRVNGDAVIRNHFDSNTSLYVDKIEARYSAICGERLGLLEKFVEAYAGQPLAVLDVGCGAGVFTDLVLGKHPQFRAYCLDSSLGILKRNAPVSGKSLVMGDAKALPFRPHSFDLINLDTLMHHMVDFEGYRDTLGAIEQFLSSLRGLLKPGGFVMVREIYHEFVLRENLGTHLIYGLSTLQLPGVVANLVKRLGLKTANAGVCFLTRQQWSTVFARAGYKILSFTDKPWSALYLRIMGFRRSGDLYYTISPDVEASSSNGDGKKTLQTVR